MLIVSIKDWIAALDPEAKFRVYGHAGWQNFPGADSIKKWSIYGRKGFTGGDSLFQTFRRIVFPLSMPGVKAGIQAVFIPSLSLFMITRLIGGNRVITLGTAIEEHFLTTQNWGMGSTIGVVLILAMFIVMFVTGDTREKGGRH